MKKIFKTRRVNLNGFLGRFKKHSLSGDTYKQIDKTKITKLLNKDSLWIKMALVFLLLIVIPVFIIGYISTSTASSSLISSAEASFETSTMHTAEYFDLILDKSEYLARQISLDAQIQQYAQMLLNNDGEAASLEQITMANKQIESLLVSDSTIRGINIILNNGEYIGNLTSKPDMMKVEASDWYKKAMDAKGSTVWVGNDGQGDQNIIDSRTSVSLVKNYKSAAYAESLGVIIINKSYDAFSSYLSNIHLGKEDLTYLITNDGKILSAKGEKEDSKIAVEPILKNIMNKATSQSKDLFYINENGVNYLVSYYKSEKSNWTSVSIIPKKEITSGSNIIKDKTISLGVVFAILALIFGFLYSLKMTMEINNIMNAIEKARNGELSVSIRTKRRDEIGKLAYSFNIMMEQIKDIILQNRNMAVHVGESSKIMTKISKESADLSSEISRAIEEVASCATSQALDVESSVDNISQLADKINIAVEYAKAMETVSQNVKEYATNGFEVVESLKGKTAETNMVTKSVVSEITKLNDYVKDISKITRILKSIADQTNMLSLNASIEAARAGAEGRGFVVVANEVKKLAKQSSEFTKGIEDLVQIILQQAQKSTELVNASEQCIEEQSNMVEQTAGAFSEIKNYTETLLLSTRRITDVISNMDNNKEQVVSNIKNMSAGSELIASTAEEVSAASQEQLSFTGKLDDKVQSMDNLTQKLVISMEKFKL